MTKAKSPKPLHGAFSVDYSERKREIVTECFVGNTFIPSSNLQKGMAIWDTGATQTVINPRLSKLLNLQATGRDKVRGVSGEQIALTYIVDIFLPNHFVYKGLNVVAIDFGERDILIGMDIIGAGDFAICGGKFFSFALPSFENPIDFVKKTERVNLKIEKQNRKIQKNL